MKSDAATRWRISVDRRRGAHEIPRIREHLATWLPGVQGLSCRWFTREEVERLPDQGAFRDYIPLVDISHTHTRVLEYVGEEIIEAFGWLIDVHPVARGE